MSRTIFVCIILTISALFFSKDVNDLALRPIEKMMEKVNKIAQNPLSSKNEQLIKENEGDSGNINEAKLIYNSIIKIGKIHKLYYGKIKLFAYMFFYFVIFFLLLYF